MGGFSDREELAQLCDPDPVSLAEALLGLVELPPPIAAAIDPKRAWREATLSPLGELKEQRRLGCCLCPHSGVAKMSIWSVPRAA